ncbi:MAG TPA: ChaB family protein [Acidocella sp.]|jgi:cation transport regulator|nr:ChaB family protein [Acidocella sp.]
MPYSDNQSLPPAVRDHLPVHAQDIFRAAFNNAYAEYAGEAGREERAFRVAWAAVKKFYIKRSGHWAPRDG